MIHIGFNNRFIQLFGKVVFDYMQENHDEWIKKRKIINEEFGIWKITSTKMNKALRCWLNHFGYDYEEKMLKIELPAGRSSYRTRGKVLTKIFKEDYEERVNFYFESFYARINSYLSRSYGTLSVQVIMEEYQQWIRFNAVNKIYTVNENDLISRIINKMKNAGTVVVRHENKLLFKN